MAHTNIITQEIKYKLKGEKLQGMLVYLDMLYI